MLGDPYIIQCFVKCSTRRRIIFNYIVRFFLCLSSCAKPFFFFSCAPTSSSVSATKPERLTMASIISKNQKKKQNYTLKELKSLGNDLLSSRAHINNLPLLLSFISPESPPQFVVESLLSLQSFFTPLLSQLPSSSSSHPSSSKRPRSEEEDDDDSSKTKTAEVDEDPEVIFKAWLRSNFDEFVKVLLDVLVSQQSEDTLRVPHCLCLFLYCC